MSLIKYTNISVVFFREIIYEVNKDSISRKCRSKDNDNIEEIVNSVAKTLRFESASLAERMRSKKLKFTV
jgi:hypothetical protein